jgi:hypothetical protein
MAQTGVAQAFTWDLAAGSTPKAAGLLVGGDVASADQETTVREGAYSQASFWHGPVKFATGLQVEATGDTKALMAYAKRDLYTAAGVLTPLKVSASDGVSLFAYTGTVINSLKASGSVDTPLQVDFGFLHTVETESAASLTGVALATELLPCQNAAVTIGGAAYHCQGFDFSLDNGCQHYFDLDSKTTNTKRLPSGITLGIEKVTLNADFLTKIAWDVDADAPSDTIAAIIAYSLGAATLTATFSNLAYTGARAMPIQTGSGLVVWRYQFVGKPGSLVIT